MSEQTLQAKPSTWVTWALVAAVVAVFILSLWFAQGAEFEGTDALATELLESDGAEPWFEPMFEPSGEVESGLFALQAALGAGVLGYVAGRLHERAGKRQ